MEQSIYAIEGMTCQSCVKTIKEKISSISGVVKAKVSLEDGSVEILSKEKIDLKKVSESLSDLPKYKVSLIGNSPVIQKVSILKTYKPLITIFSFILLISLAFQISSGFFQPHLFMNHIMAGFFIGLSFFKFLDLKAFAASFSGYDPLAKKWRAYGYIYPFIEITLGFLFVENRALLLANTMTIVVLSLTTFGVYKKLQSKSQFQCACLGTSFNLPLSNVTIFENVVMILMAVFGLFFK